VIEATGWSGPISVCIKADDDRAVLKLLLLCDLMLPLWPVVWFPSSHVDQSGGIQWFFVEVVAFVLIIMQHVEQRELQQLNMLKKH
jgi:hypothetical protein